MAAHREKRPCCYRSAVLARSIVALSIDHRRREDCSQAPIIEGKHPKHGRMSEDVGIFWWAFFVVVICVGFLLLNVRRSVYLSVRGERNLAVCGDLARQQRPWCIVVAHGGWVLKNTRQMTRATTRLSESILRSNRG